MSVFTIEHRAALVDKQPIRLNGVSIEALPEGHALHALASTSDGDLSSRLRQAAGGDALSVRFVAPGQWFIVGDAPLSRDEFAAFAAKLSPTVDLVDQGHGRVRIALSGENAARVLAKGTAIDLAVAQFPLGQATTTLIGHISAHVTRLSASGFELMVLRGFAESLWDELVEMSGEFR